jgi:hypothetical protein
MAGMKKNTTKRPNGLTPAERRAWDEIVREMESRGIDPKGRVALIKDYIKLEARIARLSSREEDPVLGNVQTSRAINVAVAERRRLHAASARPIQHGRTSLKDWTTERIAPRVRRS